MNELNDATEAPNPGIEASTPGAFAALWNTRTDEQRQAWLDNIRRDAKAAMRCWLEQHEHNEDAGQASYAAAEAAWSKAVHDA